jgi:hypothetical protein
VGEKRKRDWVEASRVVWSDEDFERGDLTAGWSVRRRQNNVSEVSGDCGYEGDRAGDGCREEIVSGAGSSVGCRATGSGYGHEKSLTPDD